MAPLIHVQTLGGPCQYSPMRVFQEPQATPCCQAPKKSPSVAGKYTAARPGRGGLALAWRERGKMLTSLLAMVLLKNLGRDKDREIAGQKRFEEQEGRVTEGCRCGGATGCLFARYFLLAGGSSDGASHLSRSAPAVCTVESSV